MFFKYFITISEKKDNPTDMHMNYSQKTGKLCSLLAPIWWDKKQESLFQWTVAWGWSGSSNSKHHFLSEGPLSEKKSILDLQTTKTDIPATADFYFLLTAVSRGRQKQKKDVTISSLGNLQGPMKHML